MRISDGSSDVCSSDLPGAFERHRFADPAPDVGGDPARDRCFPAHREQFGRGVEARKTLDLPRTIEFHVDPATAAEFEHMAARAGYALAAQLHHLSLRTSPFYKARYSARKSGVRGKRVSVRVDLG